jgi:hypothetical protein
LNLLSYVVEVPVQATSAIVTILDWWKATRHLFQWIRNHRWSFFKANDGISFPMIIIAIIAIFFQKKSTLVPLVGNFSIEEKNDDFITSLLRPCLHGPRMHGGDDLIWSGKIMEILLAYNGLNGINYGYYSYILYIYIWIL